DVNLTYDGEPIHNDGGRLYFSRSIMNDTAETQIINKWAYITFPNGFIYNREKVKTMTLASEEEAYTANAYFDIPAHWPSGEYTYQVNTMTVPNVEQSSDKFIFTKD
ncbi:RbmA family biofilm matrix protein, partial [Shewanella surugensis]